MASLRAYSAARLLRNASQTNRTVLPAARRFESNVPMVPREQAPETNVKRLDPNYEATFDKATSYVLFLGWGYIRGEVDTVN